MFDVNLGKCIEATEACQLALSSSAIADQEIRTRNRFEKENVQSNRYKHEVSGFLEGLQSKFSKDRGCGLCQQKCYRNNRTVQLFCNLVGF